jgi:glycerol-3-phosphate dehydrogenase (NAD(P)+)
MRATVVGAGAWGTALAHVLARGGHDVTLWAFEPEVAEDVRVRQMNTRFLPSVSLHPSLRASPDLAASVGGAPLIVWATPSHVLRLIARQAAPAIAQDAVLVVATKGIEESSLDVMTEVVGQELPGRAIVALSGPTFASEVAEGQPSAIVAASTSDHAARLTQQAFSSDALRVYTQHDVTGVELGGSLKNVMAVATGIAEGAGLGFNSRAALITRGLAEMTRLGVALGASAATFAGLAGMGDLVLTCTGSLSRNRAIGIEVGEGRALEQALEGKRTVAEGVRTTRSARALGAREGVEMPIVEAVHRILFEQQSPRAAIGALMARDLRAEHD